MFRTQVGELKAILSTADLQWPQPSTASNVLIPFLYLCREWPLLFIVVLDKHRSDAFVLAPTGQFSKLVKIRDDALNNAKHNKLFELLYMYYVTDQLTAVTYSVMSAVESISIAALGPVLSDSTMRTYRSAADLAELTPWMTEPRQRWEEAWRKLGLSESAPVVVRGAFVRTLLNLSSVYGAANLTHYMGWVVAQLFAIYTDADIMTEFYYGTREATERWQRMVCFNLIEGTMGFAFNAEYANRMLTPDVRADVRDIVVRVRNAFSALLSSPGNLISVQDPLPLYGNGTGAVFEYFDRSSGAYLTRAFSGYTDMSPLLTKTYQAVNRGFSTVPKEDVTPAPLTEKADQITLRDTALLSKTNLTAGQFSLMPYALDFPVYALEAPPSIRYGGIGSEVATAMASLLFGGRQSWSNETTQNVLNEITCFLKRTQDSWELTNSEWKLVYRLASVVALWDAFRSASGDAATDFLADHPNLEAARLFFFAWCYVQCGEPSAKDACDVPLKHVAGFADAFGCKSGTPMRTDWRCSFFG
ncbi:neprilysin-1-like [Haemaphysalis longicornis]